MFLNLSNAPRCGQLNPSSALYCIRCGYPLKQEEIEKIRKEETHLLAKITEIEEKLNKLLGH